jgi:diacylglycerol kinase family enzyme
VPAGPGGRAFTALVNPAAGRGRAGARWEPVADRLRAAGADVRTERPRSAADAAELARRAAADGRIAVAVGGDGLVRDVAGGVVRAAGTMAIVPAGRGNDLAGRLGIVGRDPVEVLLHGVPRRIDVIDAAGLIVPGNVYAGVDSLAGSVINATRRLPPLLAYRLAPVRVLARWHPVTFRLTVDGTQHTVAGHSVVIANSGRYGHGLAIVPSAEPDDGLLDVLVVGAGPRRAIVSFLRQARSGAHVRRADVTVLRGRDVHLAADRPLPAGADGDELGPLPISVRIRPGALPILA